MMASSSPLPPSSPSSSAAAAASAAICLASTANSSGAATEESLSLSSHDANFALLGPPPPPAHSGSTYLPGEHTGRTHFNLALVLELGLPLGTPNCGEPQGASVRKSRRDYSRWAHGVTCLRSVQATRCRKLEVGERRRAYLFLATSALCLKKGLVGLCVPARAGTRNSSKPFLRHKVESKESYFAGHNV